MSFISINFYVFIGIVLLVYYAINEKYQWIVLLLASTIFYCFNGVENLPFIVTTSLVTYLIAKRIEQIYISQDAFIKSNELSKEEEKEIRLNAKKKCKRSLYLAFFIIIGLLFYAKAGKWIVANTYSLLNLNTEGMPNIIMALGISYYTFSAIAYLADVYWRKEHAEKNYFKVLLFLIYFPKILQGPISRYKNLAPQLVSGHKFNYKEFCYGLQLMLWGYFKKMVIADRVAILVNQVFGDYEAYSGSTLLVAAVFGAVQLYCDFSGCMDIARGFSQAIGIELESNFDHPFFAKSAAEFWRRWHITLGTWFKDYVYMPLVISPKLMKFAQFIKKKFGNRAGKSVMTIIPLAVVWILTGVWHGTGWNYVVWGVYWGTIIIFSTVFDTEIKKITKKLRINVDTPSWKIFQMVRTFMLFVVGRILTIPGDLNISKEILKKMFVKFNPVVLFDGSLFQLGLDRSNFTLALVSIFILWAVSMLQERGSVRDRIANCNVVFRWTIYYIAFFAVMILGIYGPGYDASSFVYMNY